MPDEEKSLFGDPTDMHQRFLQGVQDRANSFLDGGDGRHDTAADDAISSGRQAMKTGRDAIHQGRKAVETGRKVERAGRNAIKMGHKAVSSAAKMGGRRAAAVVANVAGAKVKGGVIAAIIAVVLAIILIFALMSVPNAIFESAQDMMETWDTIKYTDEHEGNGLLNVLDFIGTTAEKAGSSLVNAVKGLWDKLWNSSDATDGDTAGVNDINATTQELISRLATIKKALGVNDKYRTRANQVSSAVVDEKSAINKALYEMITEMYLGNDSQSHDSSGEVGRMWYQPVIRSHITYLGTDKGSSPSSQDVIDDLTDICDKAVSAKTLTELKDIKQEFTDTVNDSFPQTTDDGCNNMEAISYLYLASVQQGGSVSEMKMSDFMRYLGYTGSGSTTFNIGHITTSKWQITGSVPAWQGSFKPQYMMEELKHYQDKLILAEAYDDEVKADDYKDVIKQYKEDGAPMIDLIVSLDFPDLNIMSLSYKEHRYESYSTHGGRDWVSEDIYVYENPDGEQGTLTLKEWDVTYNYTSPSPTTKHYRQFYIDYYIKPRSSTEVMSLVGLWDGDFPSPIEAGGD